MALTDRARDALRVIVREMVAEIIGLPGIYSYRVDSCDNDKISATPVDGAALPGITDGEFAPGAPANFKAKVKKGSVVGVMFLDGKRTAPRVITVEHGAVPDETSLEDATSITAKAPLANLDASQVKLGTGAALGVARMTDPVLAGPFTGTITMGSTKVTAA